MQQNKSTQLCYLLGPYFSQWLWDAETLSRVTPYEIVHLMADRMRQLYGQCQLWSPFANLGNEVAVLASQGFRVVCSEERAAALCRRNLENAGLAPALKLALELDPLQPDCWPAVDAVLLNPPWGADYDRPRRQHFDLAKLQVHDRPFGELFEAMREHYGNVVVVCPTKGVPFERHYPADATIEFTKIRLLFYVK